MTDPTSSTADASTSPADVVDVDPRVSSALGAALVRVFRNHGTVAVLLLAWFGLDQAAAAATPGDALGDTTGIAAAAAAVAGALTALRQLAMWGYDVYTRERDRRERVTENAGYLATCMQHPECVVARGLHAPSPSTSPPTGASTP